MRPHAPLIALVLACVPLFGHAQILTRPLSGQQREEFERCMKEAGEDAAKARACVKASIDGQPVTTPEQPATPTPTPTEPATPVPSEPVPSEPPPTTPVEQPTPETPVPPSDERTQAERDYDALYGTPDEGYADPNLPTPATMPTVYDPWEKYNRKMHR